MLDEAVETAGDLGVPLGPIMTAGPGMKFVGKMEFLEPSGKAAVWIEKGLVVS